MKIEELKLRFSYRAMLMWEQIMDKPFSIDGKMTSLVVLLWCIIEANNPGTITLEDFFKWIDDEPKEFNRLCEWYTKEQQRNNDLLPDSDSDDKKKATQE